MSWNLWRLRSPAKINVGNTNELLRYAWFRFPTTNAIHRWQQSRRVNNRHVRNASTGVNHLHVSRFTASGQIKASHRHDIVRIRVRGRDPIQNRVRVHRSTVVVRHQWITIALQTNKIRHAVHARWGSYATNGRRCWGVIPINAQQCELQILQWWGKRQSYVNVRALVVGTIHVKQIQAVTTPQRYGRIGNSRRWRTPRQT